MAENRASLLQLPKGTESFRDSESAAIGSNYYESQSAVAGACGRPGGFVPRCLLQFDRSDAYGIPWRAYYFASPAPCRTKSTPRPGRVRLSGWRDFPYGFVHIDFSSRFLRGKNGAA